MRERQHFSIKSEIKPYIKPYIRTALLILHRAAQITSDRNRAGSGAQVLPWLNASQGSGGGPGPAPGMAHPQQQLQGQGMVAPGLHPGAPNPFLAGYGFPYDTLSSPIAAQQVQ